MAHYGRSKKASALMHPNISGKNIFICSQLYSYSCLTQTGRDER